MTTKRSILEMLKRPELQEIAQRYEVSVPNRHLKSRFLDLLARDGA